ncbi:hypothetical protein F442_12815 [Phytophthora nicotianae P10297]|uniref:Uncharacterized protein n=1 Tax=Phytophthora nicotianae P10297 TaxID=1317064 RepID=W2YYF3_PHYNI|nr:hypothetical protein F442_12815 [Phytophthora nicotianae P10297]
MIKDVLVAIAGGEVRTGCMFGKSFKLWEHLSYQGQMAICSRGRDQFVTYGVIQAEIP